MRILIWLALVAVEMMLGEAIGCIKHTGEAVKWWIAIKVPPKIGRTSFAIYDSTMTSGKFNFYDLKFDTGTISSLQQERLLSLALSIRSISITWSMWHGMMKSLQDRLTRLALTPKG